MNRTTLLIPLVALVAALTAVAADVVLIQAESTVEGTGAEVLADDSALGGSYTMSNREWKPVFKLAMPTGADSYTVWIRARGVALQLKAAETGSCEQKGVKWNWKPSATWAWKSYGTYPASDLGAEITIIRGQEAADDAGLDAVIIASDPGFDPTVDGAVDGLSEQ